MDQIRNGTRCTVVAGTYKGRSGTAEDWKLSKTLARNALAITARA